MYSMKTNRPMDAMDQKVVNQFPPTHTLIVLGKMEGGKPFLRKLTITIGQALITLVLCCLDNEGFTSLYFISLYYIQTHPRSITYNLVQHDFLF